MKKIIGIIILSIAFTSCATLFSGTKDGVAVKGYPEGAKVYYNGNFEGNSPCKVKVSKNSLKNGAKIKLEAPGYETAEVSLTKKMKTGAFIFDFFIFPGGHIIDFVTGAIYKPYPNKVEFNLNSKVETN